MHFFCLSFSVNINYIVFISSFLQISLFVAVLCYPFEGYGLVPIEILLTAERKCSLATHQFKKKKSVNRESIVVGGKVLYVPDNAPNKIAAVGVAYFIAGYSGLSK